MDRSGGDHQLRVTYLENEVASGNLAPIGLEDLKSALDDLRLRAWGLLMATSADDHHQFQSGSESAAGRICAAPSSLTWGTGQLSGGHPELVELGAAGRDLATAVEAARQRAV